MARQEYSSKPLTKREIRGASSKAIYVFMTVPTQYLNINKIELYYPRDVDDFERNRALLLWYPEWIPRLVEMATVNPFWHNIGTHYQELLDLYEQDYQKYSHKGYGIGACDNKIRELVKR